MHATVIAMEYLSATLLNVDPAAALTAAFRAAAAIAAVPLLLS
jgi:hypothetical protein